MLKGFGFGFLIFSVLSLVGCSSGSGGGQSGNTKTIEIQGKSPGDYFNQFIYRVQGDCQNPGGIYFKHLSSDDIPHGKLPNGHSIFTQINVYLKEDHSFSALYEEKEVVRSDSNGYSFIVLVEKKLKGTWKVEEEQMVLSDLGHGSGIKYQNRDAILFNFDHDISREDLKGKSSVLRMVLSSAGEQSINEYCGEMNQ